MPVRAFFFVHRLTKLEIDMGAFMDHSIERADIIRQFD